jgi:pilus assembly protein FimV
MRQRIMLSFYGFIIAMAVFSTHAGAVSLGKIDVASHLGEPFYAEVPLTLDEGEVISGIVVELAEPSDYRILEVYRDRALQMVRANVERDSRGSRVELTSRTAIDAPFFNLVLKVRYGRATHFKKYPVFLDLPRAAAPSKGAAPLPSVSVEEAAREAAEPTVTAVEVMPVEEGVAAEEAAGEQPAPFRPHDQWARTSHYGPMVYGDTISTVADRLRIDGRYSQAIPDGCIKGNYQGSEEGRRDIGGSGVCKTSPEKPIAELGHISSFFHRHFTLHASDRHHARASPCYCTTGRSLLFQFRNYS